MIAATSLRPKERRVGRDAVLVAPSLYFCPYSSECVEEEFCELRHNGVLGSSAIIQALLHWVRALWW
jgi:hypothetical protein